MIIRLVSRPGCCCYLGLSTDTKPANPPNDYIFIEADTFKNWIGQGGVWVAKIRETILVGGIYTSDLNINPGTLLGYGTWILIGRANIPILGPPPTTYQPYLWKRTA